ncbi:hypothetical protein [Cupriavidus sp. DL-D2]
MDAKPDLIDWITPDISLSEDDAAHAKRCLGCGAEIVDEETPHCGH